MFYVSNENGVYQTNSRDIAEMIGSDIEELGANIMHIDFGGIFVNGMEYIDVQINDFRCRILAHHLGRFTRTIHAALKEDNLDYITVRGYPFTYAISRMNALALQRIITANWNEYHAQELHNIQTYEDAIRSLEGYTKVDVKREIATIKQREVQ